MSPPSIYVFCSWAISLAFAIERENILLNHTGCFRFHRPAGLLEEGRGFIAFIKSLRFWLGKGVEGGGRREYNTKRPTLVFFLGPTLIKKKIKFSSYRRKFRVEQLQSHIWLTASSNMGNYLRNSSYIRKPFLIYDFATAPLGISLYMRKIYFLFCQCTKPL